MTFSLRNIEFEFEYNSQIAFIIKKMIFVDLAIDLKQNNILFL